MPSWKDLSRFLAHDSWEYMKKNSGTDRAYTKTLSNGDILFTRVSKSSKEIGPGLFAEILKQLACSKEYFSHVLSSKRYSSDDPAERK